MSLINATEFINRRQNGESMNVLDVREALEYATYNIGGKNVPLSVLSNYINQLDYNKTDEIIVICKVGLRSETAQLLLNQNGYKNVRNLSGGLIALQKINQVQNTL